jgi:hypothetical protein
MNGAIGGRMRIPRTLPRFVPLTLLAAVLVWLGPLHGANNLNPKAIAYKLPDQIKWNDRGNGSLDSVLFGDPSKPGMYGILVKWTAHHMSHPHYHPNNRYVTVISGTWWVGTGTKWDPESTVPLGPGSTGTHFAKEVHWDGAKDADVILEIVGEGPGTSTAVPETK